MFHKDYVKCILHFFLKIVNPLRRGNYLSKPLSYLWLLVEKRIVEKFLTINNNKWKDDDQESQSNLGKGAMEMNRQMEVDTPPPHQIAAYGDCLSWPDE